MANIEKRRIKRRTVMILIAAGALVTVGAIVALLVIFIPRCDSRTAVLPTEPANTAEASAVPTALITLPPETDRPVQTAPAAPPVRVTDDTSVMILAMTVQTVEDDEGNSHIMVSGSAALEFINNTDQALYSADLIVGGMNVESVTVNGVASGFSVSDDGVLTIPFLDELGQNETREMFFSFSMELEGDEITLPYFAYDTSFELRVKIRPDIRLEVPGAVEKQDGEAFIYETDGETVTKLTISVIP